MNGELKDWSSGWSCSFEQIEFERSPLKLVLQGQERKLDYVPQSDVLHVTNL